MDNVPSASSLPQVARRQSLRLLTQPFNSSLALFSLAASHRSLPHSCRSALRLLVTPSPHGKSGIRRCLRTSQVSIQQVLRKCSFLAPLLLMLPLLCSLPSSSFAATQSAYGILRRLCLGSPAGRSLPARLSCFLLSRFAHAKNPAKRLPRCGCYPPCSAVACALSV